MVSNAGVKIKVMPDSPERDLIIIESKVKRIIEENQGTISSTEQEPVAFGLKAIIITFSIIETFEQDPLMDKIRAIKNVSSAEIVDFRRIGF